MSRISRICMHWLSWFDNVICNGYHDLTMLSININDTAITVKNVDYCCVIHSIKSEAVSLLKDSVLED